MEPSHLIGAAKCRLERGDRNGAIGAFSKAAALDNSSSRYSAYEGLAGLGVRLAAPDVAVRAERDPASYRATCSTLVEPGTESPGGYACSALKDFDDTNDGRRRVQVSLLLGTDLRALETAARSRDRYKEATGMWNESGSLTFNCQPRDTCKSVECPGSTYAEKESCVEAARESCDDALAKCATPASVVPGDCAVVWIDAPNARAGVSCNGRANEFNGKPRLFPGEKPPDPAVARARAKMLAREAEPLPSVSAAVLACCTGRVTERSTALPPASELMDAFRLGTHQVAGPGHHYIFQTDIAEALIKLNNKSVIPELKELLHRDSREMRDDAAWVLAKLGDDEGIARVMEDARDTSSAGREHPLVGTEAKSQQTLRQTSQDRYYAVRTLGKIGDARAVPLLCELANDQRLDYAAAYALEQIGDGRARLRRQLRSRLVVLARRERRRRQLRVQHRRDAPANRADDDAQHRQEPRCNEGLESWCGGRAWLRRNVHSTEAV